MSDVLPVPALNPVLNPLPSLSGVTVLVVDDSEDNALLVSMLLKSTGCRLEFARNGREAAVQFAKVHPELVLMDLQMPEMDGFTASRWIRVLEKQLGKKTSIVALTAFASPKEIQKCLDAGCDGYILKPFQKSTLIATMGAHLGDLRSNRSKADVRQNYHHS